MKHISFKIFKISLAYKQFTLIIVKIMSTFKPFSPSKPLHTLGQSAFYSSSVNLVQNKGMILGFLCEQ